MQTHTPSLCHGEHLGQQMRLASATRTSNRTPCQHLGAGWTQTDTQTCTAVDFQSEHKKCFDLCWLWPCRKVPGLSNDQNWLHRHRPFTLSTPGSSPHCCDRGLNISASSISICFILWQCNPKSQRLVSKDKAVHMMQKRSLKSTGWLQVWKLV